jgi:hypothetical protein
MVFPGLSVVVGTVIGTGGTVVLEAPMGFVVSDEIGGSVITAPGEVVAVVTEGEVVIDGTPMAGTTLVGAMFGLGFPTTTAVTTGAKTGTEVEVVVVAVGGIVAAKAVVVVGGAIVSITTV